jgi:hypothetical protein
MLYGKSNLWNVKLLSILIGTFFVLLHLFSPSNVQPVQAQICAYIFRNATDFITPTSGVKDVYGVRAKINFTNPYIPIIGGGSYHRVSAYQSGNTPGEEFRYYEFGWVTLWQTDWVSTRQGYYLGWNLPGNDRRGKFEENGAVTTGTHTYSVFYLVSSGRWQARFNGNEVQGFGRLLDWGSQDTGRNALVGGEAVCGNEQFNCVLSSDLETRGYFGTTTLQWRPWARRRDYLDNAPYNNQNLISGAKNIVYSHHNYTFCPGATLASDPPAGEPESGYGE